MCSSDLGGVLLKRLHETVDGAFQTYAATDGRFNRENFFNKYSDLRALIGDMSDEQRVLAGLDLPLRPARRGE